MSRASALLSSDAFDSAAFSSVTQILQWYRSGKLTPSAVVEMYLQRLEKLNTHYNAYVADNALQAREAAQAATLRWQQGTARALEGVPIAVKDLIDVAGLPTRAGSLTLPDTPVSHTATVVRLLQDAGAIVLGKVHTEEYAFGSWGVNESMGVPLNPWSGEEPLVPGGSSSGSAVAVAAGLAPWAIGTDTGGSVRGPAAWQGLVGYKPTVGRISKHGVLALSLNLDSVGVLCRSVADVVLFTRVVQGPDVQDTQSWNQPNDDVGSMMEEGVAGLKLAVLADSDRAAIAPDVLAVYDELLSRLQVVGAELVTLSLPFTLASLASVEASPMLASEAYARYAALADDPLSQLSTPVRARMLSGKISMADYLQRTWANDVQLQHIRQAMQGCAALVMPTMPFVSPEVRRIDQTKPSTVLTRFVNQLGWCGVAVPAGMNSNEVLNLPVSVQCVAPAHADAMAIRVARAVELLTPPLPLPHQVNHTSFRGGSTL